MGIMGTSWTNTRNPKLTEKGRSKNDVIHYKLIKNIRIMENTGYPCLFRQGLAATTN